MGAAFFISLEREIPGLDTGVDGKALSAASDALETVAKRLKVRPLLEFFSAGAEEFADLLGEGVELPGDLPPKQFHDAEEGLKTVQALMAHCRKSPGNLKQVDRILGDLGEFERILTAAKKAGVTWHLSIDL